MARHRKGSSKSGRPRQPGNRYPSGKLKPPEPNAVVVALRRANLPGDRADLTKAENAIDLALARGWLTEDQTRAAWAYHQLHRKAGNELPTLKIQNLDKIAKAFDPSLGSGGAADLCRDLHASMTADERAMLFEVCVLLSWPQWVVQRCAGHFDTAWERKRNVLVSALDVVDFRLQGAKGGGNYRNERLRAV